MKERTDNLICVRANDLVAYLYNEASEAEAGSFESHIESCATCRQELAAFGHMRESIGEWRMQSLGSIASPAVAANAMPMLNAVTTLKERKRSALAALREFFTLSPNWMRAATAFATLVICALVAIAVIHFKSPQQTVVEKVNVAPSEQQVNAMVEQRVKEQMAALQAPKNVEPLTAPVSANESRVTVRRNSTALSGNVARSNAQRQVNRRQSQQEMQLAAAPLPFTASRETARLPRLSDLVDESN